METQKSHFFVPSLSHSLLSASPPFLYKDDPPQFEQRNGANLVVGVGRDELVRLGLLGNLGDDGRPGVVVGELVCKIPIKSKTRFCQ
jgi:hypothetical protein